MAQLQNLALLVLAIGIVVVAIAAANNGSSQQNTIQVTGEAKLTTAPDKAVVFISAEHKKDTAAEAQSAVAEAINKVMKSLENNGVSKEEIETSSFRVYPNNEWNSREQKYEQNGFIAVHSLKATVTELDKVGKILDDAVKAGATGIDQVSFELTDESQDKLRKQLLSEAGSDARKKAEAIASGLGVSLGKVVSAQESGPIYIPYLAKSISAAEAGTEISPQSLEVSISIAVSYQAK